MPFNYWLLRVAANFDLKLRMQTAKTFMKANQQLAEESKHDYMRRVHWAVLQTHGLPPFSMVNFWLRSNKPYILAPTDQIERYLIENEGKPLPDGKLDERITNGQGRMILELLRESERSDRDLLIPSTNPATPTSSPRQNDAAFQRLCVAAARTELESSWCADVISKYKTADRSIVTMTFAAYIFWLMHRAFTQVLPSDEAADALMVDALSSVMSDFFSPSHGIRRTFFLELPTKYTSACRKLPPTFPLSTYWSARTLAAIH